MSEIKVSAFYVSDLADLWVIKIKSPWTFARVVRRDHVNRAGNADHAARTCETVCLFFSLHFLHLEVCRLFFLLDCAFRVLIGWAVNLVTWHPRLTAARSLYQTQTGLYWGLHLWQGSCFENTWARSEWREFLVFLLPLSSSAGRKRRRD